MKKTAKGYRKQREKEKDLFGFKGLGSKKGTCNTNMGQIQPQNIE
jgi:hypothetical protein